MTSPFGMVPLGYIDYTYSYLTPHRTLGKHGKIKPPTLHREGYERFWADHNCFGEMDW